MTDTKTKSESLSTNGHNWFVVRGNWLPNGSKIAGPFTTKDNAFRARDGIEKFTRGETFFIDSEPA